MVASGTQVAGPAVGVAGAGSGGRAKDNGLDACRAPDPQGRAAAGVLLVYPGADVIHRALLIVLLGGMATSARFSLAVHLPTLAPGDVVLVVDDAAEIRMAMGALLRGRGCQVLTAAGPPPRF